MIVKSFDTNSQGTQIRNNCAGTGYIDYGQFALGPFSTLTGTGKASAQSHLGEPIQDSSSIDRLSEYTSHGFRFLAAAA
ncbi:MAG: hypothetical protein R3C05_09080 [Pirellulaceae bacterium]